LGYQILRQNFKTLQKPDEGKMTGILEALEPAPLYGKADWRKMLNLAERLAGFVKNYLINYSASNFREEILRIADHHGLDLNNCFDQAAGLVPKALDECKRRAPVSIDFDDMIWLPVVLDLQIQHPGDMLIVDESQDLNVAQHELIFKACKGRFVVVGDTHQSIYAFRGAHAESMQVLTKRLGDTSSGVREFPLTITRRCPKLHVQMAQSLFPDIRALDDAPIGEILQMPRDKAVQEMKPGDLVICRVNAALIPTAYDLIRRGIRPIVKGRDIGKGLIQLIDTLMKAVEVIPGSDDMVKIREALFIYRYEHESKLILLGDKAQGRLEALHDKCDCLIEFIRNAKSITEMRTQVEKLFSDEPGQASNAVTLGTIHRTKGLESERVFVLAPELIPHPMARRSWEVAQEKNVAWIACTRAKFNNVTGAPGTLVFCGEIPLIYSGNESIILREP
jgi:superfamily I DNA/RNA helicase